MPRSDDPTPFLFGDDFLPKPPASGRRARDPEAAAFSDGLRALGDALPRALRLGTSSWSFPGWKGLVYASGTDPSETALARAGLAAYARHPLFRTVGVDKTYYRPAPRAEFERLAAQVPGDFRFLVKAWKGLVEADARAEAAYLDPRVAETECIRPVVEGLGGKAGPILFQFPPTRLAGTRAANAFIDLLARFLAALPKGPLYAVEVRDRTLASPDHAPRLGGALAAHDAVPCLTVHPSMPPVEMQARALALDPSRPLVMRWMLRANHAYAEARDLYAPFDRIVEPDDDARDALARLARSALAAGQDAWIVVNNKAEGSSPLSVERLARAVVDSR